MNRLRKIFATIFALLALLITITVVYEWHKMGCGFWSLVGALAIYPAGTATIWFVIDQHIQGK